MCLVISVICFSLAYSFFQSGDVSIAITNLILAIFFALLMLRNVLKTKKERRESKP